MSRQFSSAAPALAAGILAVVAVAPAAQATNGMLPHCNGIYSCGMGGAGLALATDATHVADNPALAGRLGSELSVAVGFFHPVRTLDPQGAFASNVGKMSSQVEDYPNGALGGIYRLNPDWALGLTLVPGGGGETKYTRARTGAGLAGNFDSNVRIRFGLLSPTLAWTPSPKTSYGASLVIGYQDFKSDMANAAFAETAGMHRTERVYGWGLKFGGTWDISPQATVAMVVATPVWFDRLDKYRDLFIDSVDLPGQFGLGGTWHFPGGTDVSADLKMLFWEEVDAIGTQPFQGGFGWENQPVIAIGVQHPVTPQLTVRAGWNYGPSPIPEENTFANGLFPAVTEHHVTVGASYAINQRWEAGFSAYYAPKNSQRDPGTGDMFSQAGAGTELSMYQYGGQVGLRWKF